MTSRKEKRKMWIMNLSPGNWVSIVTLTVVMLGGGLNASIQYAKAMDKVEKNSIEIEKTKQIMQSEISKLNKDITSKIGYLRSDIREVRQILLRKKD